MNNYKPNTYNTTCSKSGLIALSNLQLRLAKTALDSEVCFINTNVTRVSSRT